MANAFARDEMRKLETPQVELYYPAKEHDSALRTLRRLEQCLELLRPKAVTQEQRPRVVAYMAATDINNAFVYPEVGGVEQYMILPHHTSLDVFNWYGQGLTGVGDIACHEAVHYVHYQQTDGFWNVLNIIGGNLFQPNSAMEAWFVEGLATHYEGRLGSAVGRSENPLWRGLFLSGVNARHGELGAGDLSPLNRELLPFKGHYLAGTPFVDFLVRRYGEGKLWELMDVQGRSIFFPLGITLRFKAVYGLSIGALLEQFNEELKMGLEHREKPAGQQRIAGDLGYLARIAASRADGAIASLSAGVDQTETMTVREANGQVRFSRSFTPVVFVRPYITGNPQQASGLSFTADGKSLFLVLADVDMDGGTASRLLQLDARTGDLVHLWDLGPGALGGAISPDGHDYLFVDVSGQLKPRAAGAGVQPPRAPDRLEPHHPGRARLRARRQADRLQPPRGGHLRAVAARGSGARSVLATGGRFNYFPHWIDDRRISFVREVDGRLQVHVVDVDERVPRQLTRRRTSPWIPCPCRRAGGVPQPGRVGLDAGRGGAACPRRRHRPRPVPARGGRRAPPAEAPESAAPAQRAQGHARYGLLPDGQPLHPRRCTLPGAAALASPGTTSGRHLLAAVSLREAIGWASTPTR